MLHSFYRSVLTHIQVEKTIHPSQDKDLMIHQLSGTRLIESMMQTHASIHLLLSLQSTVSTDGIIFDTPSVPIMHAWLLGWRIRCQNKSTAYALTLCSGLGTDTS